MALHDSKVPLGSQRIIIYRQRKLIFGAPFLLPVRVTHPLVGGNNRLSGAAIYIPAPEELSKYQFLS